MRSSKKKKLESKGWKVGSTDAFLGFRGSGNVFRDIGFSPAEAANLEARSRLLICLEHEIKKLKISQAQVARLLRVKPPRVSEIMHGHIGKFSLDLLTVYLDRLGKTVEFKITKKAA